MNALTLPTLFAFSFLSGSSTMAPRVEAVFWTLVAVCTVVVVALVALNLTFLIRYRRGSPANRAPVTIKPWKIEAAWITPTVLVFLGFFAWGAEVYLDMERPPTDAYEIRVTGRQWMWDVRHPNGRREFNEIHVPVGRDIELLLSSEDVIHSLFLPAFRVKQDVVPGKTVATWFQATRPGVFHLFCTQFCGTEHAAMVGQVVAQKPEDYAAWLDAGNTDGDVVDRGRALFVKYGCSGCHSTGSTVHAPRLEGVYQTLIPLEGGAMVRADDAYLRDSILQPNKQIAAGFPGIMPSFQGVIPEGELLDLIAYLKTSRTDRPAAGTLPNPSP